MAKTGDVCVVDFAGATGTKRRPAVVVSSDLYHRHRPDLILAVITSNTVVATSATDYVLQDWSQAGLHSPSAFRAYFSMVQPAAIRKIGELSAADPKAVLQRVHLAFGT